ncbi:hypothetical protein [Sulfuriflexus mobilis]|uniref:hypothetical protein n=1 Tax=Sulfuriflexus mobilis TaxID=1811807 RepID=UPI000F84ABBE|nr:hypothetical protein [Sulfuriflexus mobilis]
MKKNTLSLSILAFALLTLLTGCSGDGSEATKKKAGKITLYEDGTYELKDKNGNPGTPCTGDCGITNPTTVVTLKEGTRTTQKKAKQGVEDTLTCWTTYDINGTAQQLCW